MADRTPAKVSRPDGSRRRPVLGATIIGLVVIGAASVAHLIIAKGVGPAVPVMFGVGGYTAALVVYWFRSKKDDAQASEHDK